MSRGYQPKRAAPQAPKQKKKMDKKKKRTVIISSVAVFFAVIICLAAVFVNSKFNLIDIDKGGDLPTGGDFVENEEDKIDFGNISDASGGDFKSILKNWATNGGIKMKDKNVINILVIGSDASRKNKDPGRATVAEKGNTDVIMLVSVNKADKKIKLVSIMRDSYTYMDGFDRYAKLNAACMNGGPAYLAETIENDYKIEIDGYALVDFDMFRDIIDVLGGVRVDVPKYVSNYMLSSGEFPKLKKMPSGDNVLLNGEQALCFSRVRHCDTDGDVSRVKRQRQVINALISECKSASVKELLDVVDVVLPSITTNIGKGDIVNYATQAITGGWPSFEMTELTMPTPDARYGYNPGNNWMWAVDYPLAAQNLQKELYGKTNITLEENRKTAITAVGGRPEQPAK